MQHAIHQRTLARWDAHQLPDHLQTRRQDEGIPADARLRRVRGDAQEGGAAHQPRTRQAGAQPRGNPRHGASARGDLRPRHQEGAHRGHRGAQGRRADCCGGRHQLRPRPDRLRDPRQRRRDPRRRADVPGDLRRCAGGSVHPLQAGRDQRRRPDRRCLRRGRLRSATTGSQGSRRPSSAQRRPAGAVATVQRRPDRRR